jgi:hypothetical protein
MVDFGTPSTTVPEVVLAKLLGKALDKDTPTLFKGQLGGLTHEIHLCSTAGNRKDVAVLGQSFLKTIGAKVELDYGALTVIIRGRSVA